MANRIKGITVEIGGDTTKLQTALKGVNTEIRNTQSQQYGAAGSAAPASGAGGLGDEGEAGNPENGGGAGQYCPRQWGDFPGAVRCAAEGDHRDGECPAELGAAGEPVGYGGAKNSGLGGEAAGAGGQYFFRGKEVPAGYGGCRGAWDGGGENGSGF